MSARILAVNVAGVGNLHGLRARRLVEGLAADVTLVDLERASRRTALAQMRELLAQQWDLVYLESTGIGGGWPVLQAAGRARRLRYIVSSGDPVAGFFRVTEGPLMGALFGVYERALYRNSSGFVGWTPYLTGRALELGAPRAVTVEGAVDLERFRVPTATERHAARTEWGIPEGNIVCGVIGSLKWVARQNYGYGWELVSLLRYLQRQDLTVMIVGDGDGRERLEAAVPPERRGQIVFTGRLPEEKVAQALQAMDIGFITQTLDSLGAYRLTTKLPEYLAAGLPVAMSPIPGFYDYVGDAGWALPALHPADPRFHEGLARWLDGLDLDEIDERRPLARWRAEQHFDYRMLRRRFQTFVQDLLAA